MSTPKVLLEINEAIATIWLNRPKVRNAFDAELVQEFINALNTAQSDSKVKWVLLRGQGQTFCAGADLKWMKGSADRGYDGFYNESVLLADLFQAVYQCIKPTVAIVQGACMGGANGLIAACDIVLGEVGTKFSFSEVKLGIIPATIAPYVIRRIGEYPARELMLTGRIFDTYHAFRCGLVNESFVHDKLESRLDELAKEMRLPGPQAQQSCKQLIHNVSRVWSEDEMKDKTIEAIVKAKMSDEGQEGMAAFLEKRKPNWLQL